MRPEFKNSVQMERKGTGKSTLVMDSPVPLMHHDPDRSWITDPDPDHPKERSLC